MKKESTKVQNNAETANLGIFSVIVRFLPLTWIIYIMYKMGCMKTSYRGGYYCDPEILFISRLIFKFKPILGKTKKGAKFIGDWNWVKLIFWEIHYLKLTRYITRKEDKIPFP